MTDLASLDDFRRLAVPGSRWLHTAPNGDEAEVTFTSWAERFNDETGHQEITIRRRAVYWAGSVGAPQPHACRNTFFLLNPAELVFAGNRVRSVDTYRVDGRTVTVVNTWTYLGPPTGPLDQGVAADRSTVGARRVDELQRGDVVYGPWTTWARDWSGPQPGYTVDHVDLSGPVAVVTTVEGWPLWLTAETLVAVAATADRPAAPPVEDPTVFLTVNTVSWLWRDEFEDVDVCISRNRLASYRGTPRPARVRRLLFDSGGFTELKRHGRWRLTAQEYLTQVRTHLAHIDGGQPISVVQQDWMCEPIVIYGGSSKDGQFVGTRQFIDPDEAMDYDELVEEHQRRSTANLVELRRLAPDLHIVPVLQGFTRAQYARHAGMLELAGIRLADEPLVGLGSVCRRQGTREIAEIVRYFAAQGVRLHGFGVGVRGLSLYGDRVASIDSNAWSYNGRQMGACPHGLVKKEANCPVKALDWLRGALDRIAENRNPTPTPVVQGELFDAAWFDTPTGLLV